MPPGNRPKGPDYSQAAARRLGSKVAYTNNVNGNRSRNLPTSRVDSYNPKGKGSRYRNEASIEDTGGVMNQQGINTEMRQASEGRQTSRVTGVVGNRKRGKFSTMDMGDAIGRRLSKSASAR